MSGIPPDSTEVLEDSPWRPTPILARQLTIGTAAALISGALLLASSLLAHFQPTSSPLGVSLLLTALAVVVQMAVLRDFWCLARELGSDELRRMSLGVLVSGWLLETLVLVDDRILPGTARDAYLGVIGVLFVGLMIYVFYPRLKKEGWGILVGLAVALSTVARVGLQFNTLADFLLFVATMLVTVTAILGLFAVRVLYGFTLIGLRDKLGQGAVFVGAGQLLGFTLVVGFWVWLLVWELRFPAIEAVQDAQKWAALVAPYSTLILMVEAVSVVGWAVLTAALFYLTRQRLTAEIAPIRRVVKPSTISKAVRQERRCEACAKPSYTASDYCRTCGRIAWGGLGGGLVLAVGFIAGGIYFRLQQTDSMMQNAALVAMGIGLVGVLYLTWTICKAQRVRRAWLEEENF